MKAPERGSILSGLAVLIVFGIIVGAGYLWIRYSTNHHDVTFTVKKSERVVDPDGKGARYMVYTDSGVFQNTDNLLNMKFDSADLYNQLEPGKTYACDAVGLRNEYFTLFENLITCSEVE